MSSTLAEARVDYEEGRFEEAARKYRAIVEIEPDNALAYQGLCRCLNRFGRHDEAIEECHRALELDPGLALPYAVLGGIYSRQQRLEESEAALRRALELDPTLEETLIMLGTVIAQQGRLEEAEGFLEEALELDPTETRDRLHHNLARVYYLQGRYAEATREAVLAFRSDPSLQRAHVVAILGHEWLSREYRILFISLAVVFAVLSVALPPVLALPFFLPLVSYNLWIIILQRGEQWRVALLVLVVLFWILRLGNGS
jgi:tetratricopeptide (TPR) repeat protein